MMMMILFPGVRLLHRPQRCRRRQGGHPGAPSRPSAQATGHGLRRQHHHDYCNHLDRYRSNHFLLLMLSRLLAPVDSPCPSCCRHVIAMVAVTLTIIARTISCYSCCRDCCHHLTARCIFFGHSDHRFSERGWRRLCKSSCRSLSLALLWTSLLRSTLAIARHDVLCSYRCQHLAPCSCYLHTLTRHHCLHLEHGCCVIVAITWNMVLARHHFCCVIVAPTLNIIATTSSMILATCDCNGHASC